MITKKGTIVSKSGEKTVKVKVVTYRVHPKYQKRYPIIRYFLVHNEDLSVEINDVVTIQQCRPYSKRKSWILSPIVK